MAQTIYTKNHILGENNVIERKIYEYFRWFALVNVIHYFVLTEQSVCAALGHCRQLCFLSPFSAGYFHHRRGSPSVLKFSMGATVERILVGFIKITAAPLPPPLPPHYEFSGGQSGGISKVLIGF